MCIFFLCVHRVCRLLNEWDETVSRLTTGFKSDKGTLNLNYRNLKKRKDKNASALKNKGGSTNPLHTFFMTLFSHVGTSSVLEFCIGDLRPVYPRENHYLYIGNKWKETNPTISTTSM